MSFATDTASTTRRWRGRRSSRTPGPLRGSVLPDGYAPQLMAVAEFPAPGRPMPGVVVNVFGLSRSVGDRIVLEDVGLVVFRGEVVAVLSDVETGDALARAIAGFDPGAGGRVDIKGSAVIVDLATGPMPRLTLADNVALGRPGASPSDISQVLAAVGLARRNADWPSSLDANERTRLAIAKALISEPSLMVLNRQFQHAGIPREEFEQLLLELQRDRTFAIVAITGDPATAVRFADRAVVFEGPRLARQVVLPYRVDRSDDPAIVSKLIAELTPRRSAV
jgi:sulfonate transport system ATP-binding protein